MTMRAYDDIVYRIGGRILESLALMYLVSREEDSLRHGPRAEVAFAGPIKGALVVKTSWGVVKELAGNMLGLEPGNVPTQEQQEDALKELANVVCGNLLPVIAGDQPVFHVDAPRFSMRRHSEQVSDNRQLVGESRLRVAAGRVDLALFVESELPVAV